LLASLILFGQQGYFAPDERENTAIAQDANSINTLNNKQ
jgi:hypothetical protein